MTEYPSLANIGVANLVEHVGGDPWAIDQTLQDGEPGEIAELSRAFFDAGACTEETVEEFQKAQERFKEAWNHENGDHPINDSAEVQRATSSLMFHRDQLPVVAAKLAGIAAGLAEAQKQSALWLDSLDTNLHTIDAAIGQGLSLHQDVTALENQAITETLITLEMIEGIRDTYSTQLQTALTKLRVYSQYDPQIDDVDGDGVPSSAERGHTAVDYYAANQQAADQELVDSGGPMTQEKADAEARLRDFAVATDPAADPYARQLAGERLDDFQMSRFTGNLPTDPVLGGNARTRAQSRLEMQRQLERGAFGLPPMTPDQATRELDEGERFARSLTLSQALNTLKGQGMTESGAITVLSDLKGGTTIGDLVKDLPNYTGPAAGTLEVFGKTSSTGKHNIGALATADAEALESIGKKMGAAGTALEILMAGKALQNGAPMGQTIGETAGSIGGGYLATVGSWALAGSAIGPEGAAGAALISSILFSFGGKKVGGWVGSQFDQ